MSAESKNRALEACSPSLFNFLSQLGRDAYFPPDIPVQAKEAAGTSMNGTIGVFTDGKGNAMPLASMAKSIDLAGSDLTRAFLYSPVLGYTDLRLAWARWQRTSQSSPAPRDDQKTMLPVVVAGLSHGLSIVADFFAEPGRPVLVGSPYWSNYTTGFALRRGADLREIPIYKDGRYSPQALIDAVDELPIGEPAILIANFPSNPGGYAPSVDERRRLRDGLANAAQSRPLMVVCDDAYAGLVYEPEVPNRSLFWDLVGVHDSLIPIKVDGATKEFSFFGGRTAFLTFGLDLDEAATEALENKLQCLNRATLGSPSATSQVVLARALESGKAEEEVHQIRRIVHERYQAVTPALAELDPAFVRAMPFNAGVFVLLQLAPELGLDPHDVRRHLIEHHDTGVVAVPPDSLRLAICSVDAESLPEMVRRIELGVRELSGRS